MNGYNNTNIWNAEYTQDIRNTAMVPSCVQIKYCTLHLLELNTNPFALWRVNVNVLHCKYTTKWAGHTAWDFLQVSRWTFEAESEGRFLNDDPPAAIPTALTLVDLAKQPIHSRKSMM